MENEHKLKAVPETYNRLEAGGRVDVRALSDAEIFPGDTITYTEVDAETREPTGKELTRKVVKTSYYFPAEYNDITELRQMVMVGLVPKKVTYPAPEGGPTLKARANLFSVMVAGEHNIDLKILPYEYNMQDMHRFEVLGQDLLHTRHGWVYHFNGGVKPHPRAWMEHTYRGLYENK